MAQVKKLRKYAKKKSRVGSPDSLRERERKGDDKRGLAYLLYGVLKKTIIFWDVKILIKST